MISDLQNRLKSELSTEFRISGSLYTKKINPTLKTARPFRDFKSFILTLPECCRENDLLPMRLQGQIPLQQDSS